MIREATTADVYDFAELAEKFYFKKNDKGSFSAMAFSDSWAKIIEAKIGKILIRESDGQPVEAIGYVVTCDFTVKPTVASMFWFSTDESHGLASGALLYRFIKESEKIGAGEIRMATLAGDKRVGPVLEKFGFSHYENTYLKELCPHQ